MSNITALSQGGLFFIGIPLVVAGVLVSLTLGSYFLCMEKGQTSTSVAVALAAAPVFVFSFQTLLTGSSFGAGHLISLLVTSTVMFQYLCNTKLYSETYGIHNKSKDAQGKERRRTFG